MAVIDVLPDVTIPRGLLHHLIEANETSWPRRGVGAALTRWADHCIHGHLEEPVTIPGELALHLTLPENTAQQRRLNRALEEFLATEHKIELADRRS